MSYILYSYNNSQLEMDKMRNELRKKEEHNYPVSKPSNKSANNLNAMRFYNEGAQIPLKPVNERFRLPVKHPTKSALKNKAKSTPKTDRARFSNNPNNVRTFNKNREVTSIHEGKGGKGVVNKRKSPINHAKQYNLHTKKRGKDGKMWIVSKRGNNVKYWKRV